MIEGYDIVCFSNDWDGDPLSKKHIMLRLARRNRVLWVNSIGNRNPTLSIYDLKRIVKKLRDFGKGTRPASESLHVFSPLVVPLHGSALARWINRRTLHWGVMRACRRLGFRNPITWTFVPASADVAGTLGERAVIYHCVDEFSEFTGADKTALLDLERRLMEKSDGVIVCSGRLLERKRQFNPKTFLVTHGVDVDHFRRACAPSTPIPGEIDAIPRPIVGFFGLIADWVDLDLIRFLAQARPEWRFVLLGNAVTGIEKLQREPNIHCLGPKPYGVLPNYAKAFDVAILPFAVNELTLNSNPLKLREYLAAGLPVVSSAIPEAERLRGAVQIARNRSEFLIAIERILVSGRTGPQLDISRQMEGESWDEKVEELSRIVTRLATD